MARGGAPAILLQLLRLSVKMRMIRVRYAIGSWHRAKVIVKWGRERERERGDGHKYHAGQHT